MPYQVYPEVYLRVVVFTVANEMVATALIIGPTVAKNIGIQVAGYCGAQAGFAAPILPIVAPALTNTKLVHDWIQCSNAPGTPAEKALTAVLVFATSGMITKTGDTPANMSAAACVVAFVTYMQQAVNAGGTPFLMAKSLNRIPLSFKQIVMIHCGFTLVILMVIGSTIFVVQYYRNLYRIVRGLPENSTKLFNVTKTIPKRSKRFKKKINKFLKNSIHKITSTTCQVKSTYNLFINRRNLPV